MSSYAGDEVATVDCTASLYDTLPFPSYSRPQCVGEFSVGEHGAVHADARNKSLLWSAVSADRTTKLRRTLDLNGGFERWQRYDEEPKLDNFLQWLLVDAQRRRVKDVSAACHQSTVLSYRGLLRTLLCTVYDRRTPWQFVARRLCGAAGDSVLLLCEFDTERKRADRRGEQGERQMRMCYWGYKFEHCVTVEQDASEPDTSRAVANRSQYCRVYRCTLAGRHRLLFAAEMDCELAADSGTFVELKTQRRLDNEHQERNFHRHKTVKWWAQSFLSGVDTILAGMRNDQGVVDRVKPFQLSALSKAGAQYWKGTACFNFLDSVLKAVDDGLACDGEPPPALLVSYEPGSGRDFLSDCVRVSKLDAAALQGEYRFLSDEFCAYFGIQ